MKGKFASDTQVSPEKSLAEIRELLRRYEAAKFGYIEEDDRVGLAFEMRGRRVRFVMPLPTKDEAKLTASNQFGYAGQYSASKHEQLVRSRWRGLVLTIKAKLESVEAGIETFEEAFLAQLVLPSGETMAEWAQPQIAAAYDQGVMPPLLDAGR